MPYSRARDCAVCEQQYVPTYAAQRTCGRVCGHVMRRPACPVNWQRCPVCSNWYVVHPRNRNATCPRTCADAVTAPPVSDADVLVRLHQRSNVTPTGCWIWTGTLDRGGYGKTKHDGKFASVHRLGYRLSVGPIPDGLTLDHLCRTRACWNPEHLEPVTQQVNLHRGNGWPGRNVRATHCPKGHPYDETNTRWRYRPDKSRSPMRDCHQCHRAQARAPKQRQRITRGPSPSPPGAS